MKVADVSEKDLYLLGTSLLRTMKPSQPRDKEYYNMKFQPDKVSFCVTGDFYMILWRDNELVIPPWL